MALIHHPIKLIYKWLKKLIITAKLHDFLFVPLFYFIFILPFRVVGYADLDYNILSLLIVRVNKDTKLDGARSN